MPQGIFQEFQGNLRKRRKYSEIQGIQRNLSEMQGKLMKFKENHYF